MKYILNSKLFIFIISGIIFGSIGVVFGYSYNAKDISYTPSNNNWNVNNVEDAITYLKNKNLSFDTPIYYENLITPVNENNQLQFNLSKGKYMIIFNVSTSVDNVSQKSSVDEINISNELVSNNSNDVINRLSKRTYNKSGTATYSGSIYIGLVVENEVFYVDVKANSSTITSTANLGFTYPPMGAVHAVQIIPMNY